MARAGSNCESAQPSRVSAAGTRDWYLFKTLDVLNALEYLVTSRKPPRLEPERRVWRERGVLLRELVRPLPSGVLRRLDAQAALAAEDAHEPTNGMLLPPGGFHNLG